jgi:hypothetical protein
VRVKKDYWEQMEMYIRDNSEAEFSHSMGPDCAKKTFEEFEELKKRKDNA